MKDLELKLLDKSLEFSVYPTRNTIKELIGISYSSFLRNECVISKVQNEYRSVKRVLKCLSCKLDFTTKNKNQKFCSQSCSASKNNTLRTKEKASCLNCGSETSSKYCSVTCSTQHKASTAFKSWLSNCEPTACNRRVKRYLIQLYGYKCSCCNISEWNNNPITLEVDHVNGDSNNSNPENVCLLCPNCHSQTETYKSKNVGKGRHSRRNRYKEGKSY